MGRAVNFTETTERQAKTIHAQHERIENTGAEIVSLFVFDFRMLLFLIEVAQDNNLQQSDGTVQKIVLWLRFLKERRREINRLRILKSEHETEICKEAKKIFSPLFERYPDIQKKFPNFRDFCLAYSVIEPKG